MAMAVIAFVACSKDNGSSDEPVVPENNVITLHASVDFSNTGTRVAPNTTDLAGTGEVNFHWEEGDQVTISNASGSSTFTVKSSSISGNIAYFEGESLSDMNSYNVTYNSGSKSVTYTKDTFKPVCSGTGNKSGFTLSTFQPVLKLQLKGNRTLGKIEYWTGDVQALTTTLTFSEGLALTSVAQTVYFPITAASTSGFTLKFYDNSATPEFIMEKTTSNNIAVGSIYGCPELEMKDYEYVDLGLSVLWATCNVGAENPQDFGDYFAWGETQPYYSSKSPIAWEKSDKGDGYWWTSYCGGSYYFTEWSPEPYDNYVLKSGYDAATANWGGKWRMPTASEINKLIEETSCTYTENYKETGVRGFVIWNPETHDKDEYGFYVPHVFFPITGHYWYTDLIDVPNDNSDVTWVYYWSSSITDIEREVSQSLKIANDGISVGEYRIRCCGLPIRPVRPK